MMIGRNDMILAQDRYYSLNCYETRVNNNVLVVGTSGSGKTRSIVTPNILQATGSYVISDPKGNLYSKYRNYLRNRGYVVKKLDFTNPKRSAHYNFFNYIRSNMDIVKLAHMLIYQRKNNSHADPFWDEAGQLLLQSLIAYLKEACNEEDRTLHSINRLLNAFQASGDAELAETPLDRMIMGYEKEHPDSYAIETYKKFRIAADKTLRSILITTNARVGLWDTPEISEMTSSDDIEIENIGRRKTAIFVVVSDTDRSMDGLVNIFLTQTMNELCRVADRECKNNCLPVPVRFILDDFATNCKIEEFPRMIASIRSRGISTMLMIQAESQLTENYGYDGKTIIGNCDTYVYLGGNDIETAKAVAERCDMPVKKILNMPVGTNWIFRRGQSPVNGINFDPDTFEKNIIHSETER
ncbi:MAG: type IV secretory system conjugative DNA transfer family protein [Oribacterium sp.]|nr:type IV secretory system conjugative DNA transfer family protein [Oribacterium sp.]